MIEIVNRQRKVVINTIEISAFANNLQLNFEPLDQKMFSIAFVSDRVMKELNKRFRGKPSTTDVLSFAFVPDDFGSEDSTFPNIGEIVISTEQARRQSVENKLPFELEIKQLVLHGALHLCGFDHETDNGEMNVKELELRRKLNVL